MEELRKLASTYYREAPKKIKHKVKKFYKQMDPEDKRYVKFKEFSAYMKKIDCKHLSSNEFFKLLKQPGSEKLYFNDVKTLFYIIYTKRPFCGGKCRKFITGMYFTCVECFDGSGSTFSVCPECFSRHKYEHEHEKFLDPMVILYLKRESPINQPNHGRSKSRAIVPAVNQQYELAKMKAMIQFMKLVASIGSIVVASQLCTIM